LGKPKDRESLCLGQMLFAAKQKSRPHMADGCEKEGSRGESVGRRLRSKSNQLMFGELCWLDLIDCVPWSTSVSSLPAFTMQLDRWRRRFHGALFGELTHGGILLLHACTDVARHADDHRIGTPASAMRVIALEGNEAVASPLCFCDPGVHPGPPSLLRTNQHSALRNKCDRHRMQTCAF
jgi:hypothetical protein